MIILFLLFVTIVPLILGNLFPEAEGSSPYALLYKWCLGWCVLYAAFYWPAEICVLTHRSLKLLILIWGMILLVLVILAVRRLMKSSYRPLSDLKAFVSGMTWTEAVSICAVFGHALVTALMMHIDDDDYMYVANATTALDTNTLLKIHGGTGKKLLHYSTEGFNRLAASPHFAFYAAVSKLFGTRPAALCHTYLPPVFTCLFFAVVFLIGHELFKGDRRKTGLFAAFAFLLHISSYYSPYTAGSFLLIRSWQGKAQCVGLIIPLLIWLYLRAVKGGRFGAPDAACVCTVLCACCLLSPMGAILAAGETFVLAVIASILLKEKKVFLMTIPSFITPLLMAAIYVKLG